MAFLSESRWRPIVLGAIAPANYLAGAKFGAVTLPLGDVTTMLILVPLWMVMLPLMVKFSQRELQQLMPVARVLLFFFFWVSRL